MATTENVDNGLDGSLQKLSLADGAPDITDSSPSAALSAGMSKPEEAAAIAPKFPPPLNPPPQAAAGDAIRIFIGDLAPHTTEASLTEYFSQYGLIVRALIKHPEGFNSQRSRSFGFISVVGQDAAQAIISTTHTIDGANVGYPELAKEHRKANAAGPPGGGMRGGAGFGQGAYGAGGMPLGNTRKIFVGGLSHQTKEGTLFTYFSQFGTLSDVVVMTEGSARRPRGFGFVTFEDASSVDLVIRSRFHPIGGRHVEVKPAVPREQMRFYEASLGPQADGSGGGGGAPGAGKGGAPFNGADGFGVSPGADGEWNYGAAAPGGYGMPGGGVVPAPYSMIIPAGVPVLNGYTPGMQVAGGGMPGGGMPGGGMPGGMMMGAAPAGMHPAPNGTMTGANGAMGLSGMMAPPAGQVGAMAPGGWSMGAHGGVGAPAMFGAAATGAAPTVGQGGSANAMGGSAAANVPMPPSLGQMAMAPMPAMPMPSGMSAASPQQASASMWPACANSAGTTPTQFLGVVPMMPAKNPPMMLGGGVGGGGQLPGAFPPSMAPASMAPARGAAGANLTPPRSRGGKDKEREAAHHPKEAAPAPSAPAAPAAPADSGASAAATATGGAAN